MLHRRALLLIAAASATLAPAAHAGTYEVLSCGAAGGINRSWTPEVSSDAITATDACASAGAFPADDVFIQFGGSLGVYTRLGAPAPAVGAYGYWRFEVPDPLRIVASRGIAHSHSESDGWRLVTETDLGEIGHCQTNEPGSGISDHCDSTSGTSGTPLPSGSTPYAQPAKWFRSGFRCTTAPCDAGSSAHAAGIALFSVGQTVADNVAPSAAVSEAPASVPAGGAISAIVSGSDQTGISRLELLVDGQVVASSSRTCDFTKILPCEAPGSTVAVRLASSGLSAGVHQITGRAYDAAGNASGSSAQPVTVVTPTAPPSTPTSTPGTPGPGANPTPTPGSGTDARRAVKLKISSVSRSGSRVRVRGQVSKGCRSRLTVTVRAAGQTRTARLTVPSSGRWGVWVSGVRRKAKLRVRVTGKATSVCSSGSSSTSRG